MITTAFLVSLTVALGAIGLAVLALEWAPLRRR